MLGESSIHSCRRSTPSNIVVIRLPQNADHSPPKPVYRHPRPFVMSRPAPVQQFSNLRLPRFSDLFAFTLTCFLGLTGCSAIRVRLGMRVDLEKTPVASIDAALPKGPGIAPGQKSPLVVTVTQPDGKILRTEGQGGGKVQWKDLQVTATIVNANQKGVLSLQGDPRVSDGKVGHVTITVPSHPDIRAAELEVPFRYDVAFVADFSGTKGSDGTNGLDGSSGISGTSGSLDPNNPSRGGDGTNGSDGGAGHDGSNGGNAPPVQVFVAKHPGILPLLEVRVSANGQPKLFLVDAQGGSLTIRADGGAAGSGGRGGRGGKGGSGGIGSPNGNSGRDGSDGRKGFDGSPGKGGLITVTYDPQVATYLFVIHCASQHGPQPIFLEAPVAPLW